MKCETQCIAHHYTRRLEASFVAGATRLAPDPRLRARWPAQIARQFDSVKRKGSVTTYTAAQGRKFIHSLMYAVNQLVESRWSTKTFRPHVRDSGFND